MITITGTLKELLWLARECEYTRVQGECASCPLHGLLPIEKENGECLGVDEVCEVENVRS